MTPNLSYKIILSFLVLLESFIFSCVCWFWCILWQLPQYIHIEWRIPSRIVTHFIKNQPVLNRWEWWSVQCLPWYRGSIMLWWLSKIISFRLVVCCIWYIYSAYSRMLHACLAPYLWILYSCRYFPNQVQTSVVLRNKWKPLMKRKLGWMENPEKWLTE